MTTTEPRQRAMRAVDLKMRADGYVTAHEVAAALGANLSTVHRAIEAQTIPGRVVRGLGRYDRWYVAIGDYLARYPEGGPSTVRAALTALSRVVPG